MGDVLIILWLPLTIAFMAVAFVVTLGATASTNAVDRAGLGASSVNRPDDRAR